MSTVALVGAAVWISFQSFFIRGWLPMSSWRFSAFVPQVDALALQAILGQGVADGEQDPVAVDSGFSRNSKAPRLVASTAVWMVACPEIMMTSGAMGRLA